MTNVITAEQAKVERGDARRLYLLSLWSPLIIAASVCGPLVWLLPLIVIGLVVIAGFFSRHAFIRWHTGQWTLLTVPALLLAFWSVSSIFDNSYDASGYVCFALFAVGGWYLGNIVGLRQTNRGQCWLWSWLAPTTQLPRPWAASLESPATLPPVSTPAVPTDPSLALIQGDLLLNANDRAGAVAAFMFAFRNGPPQLRQQAVAELEKMGEVETF